jgi:predicted phage tail component-like protein
MIHFYFNNVSSNDMGVYWLSADRTLLPGKRVIRYEIPGRDGYYEAPNHTYDNRIISGTISFLGAGRDFPSLRAKARDVARWLSGSGNLVFSDEPDKYYRAKVITAIPLEQLARIGNCFVSFDCQPFAEGVDLNEQESTDKTLPHTEVVTVAGTQDTPCIIYVTAKTNITSLTIGRKVNT